MAESSVNVVSGLSDLCRRARSPFAFAAAAALRSTFERRGRSFRFFCTFLRSFSSFSRFLERSSEASESEPMLSVSPVGEFNSDETESIRVCT